MSVTSPTSPLPPFTFNELASPGVGEEEGGGGGPPRSLDLPLRNYPFLSPTFDRLVDYCFCTFSNWKDTNKFRGLGDAGQCCMWDGPQDFNMFLGCEEGREN